MPKQPNNYTKILESVVKQIEQSKLRAFSEVNKALLQAYWNIGKELSKTSEYGKAVVERLSRDLRMRFPGIRGYSVRNLWNMKKFYEAYSILQLAIVELPNHQKMQSVTAELTSSRKLQALPEELAHCQKLQTASGELPLKLQTASAEFLSAQKLQTVSEELLFEIPWTNHLIILDMADSPEERQFYLIMCAKEKWKNQELKRQINSCLFERYMNADKPEKVTALIPKHKQEDIARHFKDDYLQ